MIGGSAAACGRDSVGRSGANEMKTDLAASLAWGIGAGLGVATGAWLTVVGEAGAPGVESLDLSSDVIGLPLAAAAIVTAAHFLGTAAARRVMRGRER
ncbi:MAG: hypothetical protein Kow0056_00850 [Coriobacteriia bacterium]